MTIFDIDAQIIDCIDSETGEVLDAEKLDALVMNREQKIENCIMLYKDRIAQADALKAEADKLLQRGMVLAKQAESAKKYVEMVLNGSKFQTDRCKVTYRKSEAVEINLHEFDWTLLPDDLLSIKDPTPNKTAIKKALKEGQTIAGCSLVTKQNMQIG